MQAQQCLTIAHKITLPMSLSPAECRRKLLSAHHSRQKAESIGSSLRDLLFPEHSYILTSTFVIFVLYNIHYYFLFLTLPIAFQVYTERDPPKQDHDFTY